MERKHVDLRKGSAQDYRRKQDGPNVQEGALGEYEGRTEAPRDRKIGKGGDMKSQNQNWAAGSSEFPQHLKPKKKLKDGAQEAPTLFGKLQIPAVYIGKYTQIQTLRFREDLFHICEKNSKSF